MDMEKEFVPVHETIALMEEARKNRAAFDAVCAQIGKVIAQEARKGYGEIDVYPCAGLSATERAGITTKLRMAGYGCRWKAQETEYERLHIWWEKKN